MAMHVGFLRMDSSFKDSLLGGFSSRALYVNQTVRAIKSDVKDSSSLTDDFWP